MGGDGGDSPLLGPDGGIGTYFGNILKTRRCDGDHGFMPTMAALCGPRGGGVSASPLNSFLDQSKWPVSSCKFFSVASMTQVKRRPNEITTRNKLDFFIDHNFTLGITVSVDIIN